MRNLVLVAALVLGTAAADAQTRRPPIDVTVGASGLSVSAEQWTSYKGEPSITWRMRTPGYAFAAGGVAITPTGNYNCQALEEGRLYRCDKVKHQSGQQYEYVIRVVNLASKATTQPPQPNLWIQDE